jgi:hypothetical protein
MRSLAILIAPLLFSGQCFADNAHENRKVFTTYMGPVTCKGPNTEYKVEPGNGRVVEFFYYQHDPKRLWVGPRGGWSYVIGDGVTCEIQGLESAVLP